MAKKNQISVLGLDGKEKSKIGIPEIFSLFPRKDLIIRAVVASESAEKQPQGRDPLAGKRNNAESWGTGRAMARVPRIKGSGFPGARNAGFAPGVVGGRLAHPPRSEKVILKKLNKKERRYALLHAISATQKRELVENRGHCIQEVKSFPIVLDDKLQTLKKTSQVLEVLNNIGLQPELDRVKNGKSIRAGKGKRRGRKYKSKKGPLIVIKDDFGIYKAARNIAGIDVINIENLNCKNLAPGAHIGRLVLWAQSAFKDLEKLEV
jgi:large subunit ribosomal protein L4e